MEPNLHAFPKNPQDLVTAFHDQRYLLTDTAATVLFLALKLDKPVLVEGPAGVGKTDLARVMALGLNRRLIRLQCYEGLDETKALYEWQYGKQLLYTQILRDRISEELVRDESPAEALDRVFDFEDIFFSERFILPRPLLAAITSDQPVVLLVDEVDKSDAEFEAFLLEVLSGYSVSIPEIGTLAAKSIPIVILTSNNSREMSDALKRRCIHLYLDFPGPEIELQILRLKQPGLGPDLARQVVGVVDRLRKMPLKKLPSISETLDWAAALVSLSVDLLTPEVFSQTLGVLLKYENDLNQAKKLDDEIKEAMAL
jgi:MoxR-like ATPase